MQSKKLKLSPKLRYLQKNNFLKFIQEYQKIVIEQHRNKIKNNGSDKGVIP